MGFDSSDEEKKVLSEDQRQEPWPSVVFPTTLEQGGATSDGWDGVWRDFLRLGVRRVDSGEGKVRESQSNGRIFFCCPLG